MDIPSIKFRYFEKLKLWHDYLSPSSVFEKEKISYWQHEKVILSWAYSKMHQHLFTAFSSSRVFQIYGINTVNKSISDQNEIKGIIGKLDIESIIKDLNDNPGKINYVMGNLTVKDFAEVDGDITAHGFPDKIRITRKGLLLGEIISEAYSKNAKWYQKNFRYYKWGLRLLMGVIFFSIAIVLLNQTMDFGVKIFRSLDYFRPVF